MKLYSRTRSYIIEGTIDNWRKIGTQVLQLCEGRNDSICENADFRRAKRRKGQRE